MAFKPIEILINAKDNASSVFSSLQAKVVAVGAAIATYFGINAFAGVVNGAADLETAMSRVKAATGASAEEMAKLRATAEAAGANTTFTSVEAAGALENLAKAGLSVNDSIGALPGVMSLAQAGDLSLAESSEYLTKIISGMGDKFTEAGRYADVLAMGANATNTSVTGLAQALSYAAPVANSLGLSLESTVAIIGKFADAGIDASRAGTALNAILGQFSNPASKFREELAAIGITTGDFEKALHQLAAAGPAGSKAIIAVGQEAGPALRALLNQGMGALDELTARLKGAEGSAAAAAKVMQDNLNGSLSGLASVWQTVKDALGTPVLPVLKEGVDQLAAAFRGAVADGTVQKFGEAIATAFKNGIQFVRDFLSTVDFGAVLARLQEFAASANETFARVSEYATNAGNTVKLAYGIMSAGVNGVLTAIYGIGSVFSEVASTVMAGVAKLRDGLAAITFGGLSESFKLAAEDARSMAQGFGEAAQAMRDKASESMQDMADSAQKARDGFAGLAGATQDAAQQTVAGTGAMAAMAKELANGAEAAAKAGAAYQQKVNAEQAAKQSADDHRAAIAQLRAEYADLVASGSIQGAAEKLLEINKALAGTPPAAKEAARAAAEAAAQIDAAFQRLGVTSAAALKNQADNAKRDYQTIKDAATSTAEDISAAFRVAAERAIEANKGIAPSWVIAEAGVRGFKIEVDGTGKAIVKSMKDAEESVHRVGRAAYGSVGGFHAMGRAAEEANKKLQQLYNRHRLVSEQSDSDIERNRKNVSGSVTVSPEYIDQLVAQRFGEQFIGDKRAEQAIALEAKLAAYRNNYGSVVRSQESLNEQHAVMKALERLERELEEEIASGRRGRESRPVTGSESSPGGVGGSGSRTSGGAGVGAPGAGAPGRGTTVNLNFNGVRMGAVSTDAAGRAALERFMQELSGGRGVS